MAVAIIWPCDAFICNGKEKEKLRGSWQGMHLSRHTPYYPTTHTQAGHALRLMLVLYPHKSKLWTLCKHRSGHGSCSAYRILRSFPSRHPILSIFRDTLLLCL